VSQDFRINAQVRALLVRQNIDLTKVEHGTTNGVIYLRGSLQSNYNGRKDDADDGRLNQIRLVHLIERAFRRIPGVRDVVFKLDRMIKSGTRWRMR